MELNLRNINRKHVKNTSWPKEKKLQCVALYLGTGNLRIAASSANVPYGLIRQWKMQPWWSEFEKELRNTDNLQLDTKLTKLVEKSLDAVSDRLENGEAVWNSKTGTIDRKPVNMKDSAKVAVDLLTKRELLRGNATTRTEAVIPMADQLKLLAAEFAKMTLPKSDVIDVEAVELLRGDDDIFEEDDDAVYDEREEGLQEGGQVVQRQASDHPEPGSQEYGETD